MFMFAIENKNNKQKINEPKLKMKTQNCARVLCICFFVWYCVFFLGRLREKKEKTTTKQKRNKKMQIAKSAYETETQHEYAKHSGAISFLFVFSISYVFVDCFFGMFPCCVVFALFMYFLFPLKCSILRHNNITIDLRWSLVADEVNKKIESWFKTTDQL